MRLLFLGDVVGRSGRDVVMRHLPDLRRSLSLDAVVINGENAANGFGIAETICRQFLDAGADVITLGNHAFDQREALVFIERVPELLRPLNFPQGTPGRGAMLYSLPGGQRLYVINAMGRVFMDAMDDPFASVDQALSQAPLGEVADAVVLDFHAETTSEKQAMGFFVDGRVSLMVGTHTHVPTADYRVLPQGTAYITDVGMCGDYTSVIGMDKTEPVHRFLTKIPSGRFEPATGAGALSGVFVSLTKEGLAERIEPVRLGAGLASAMPLF